MAVLCAKCGEELLGAINRCWRCGTEYESRSGKIDLPPLRRAPIPGPAAPGLPVPGGPLEAVVIEATTTDDVGGSPDVSQTLDAGTIGAQSPSMRRGSPFRAKEIGLEGDSSEESALGAPPRVAKYPKNAGASVGPFLAVTLGLLGLGLAYPIPLAGLSTAAVGLGLGVWGLYSKQRTSAIFGLLLCCGAIAFSGFFVAADVYRAIHGVAPWEPPTYPAP